MTITSLPGFIRISEVSGDVIINVNRITKAYDYQSSVRVVLADGDGRDIIDVKTTFAQFEMVLIEAIRKGNA
jgi:hypothetical protein